MASELGAEPAADPHRGTAPTWAAADGRVQAIRALAELGADVDQRGTFGGPDHGQGVTALHLAAQAGQRESIFAVREPGADPRIVDDLHVGDACGWARSGGHEELVDLLG